MTTRTRRPALGLEVLETRETPTVSTISTSFTRAPIDSGDTLWFSSVGRVSNLGSAPTTSIHVTDGTISFRAGGQSYTVEVPDTTITFTNQVNRATTGYSAADGWQVTAPRRTNGEVFLGGVGLPVPNGLPGNIRNVTWRANFTADAAGARVQWHWGAATYDRFGSPEQLKVKATSTGGWFSSFNPAGTPEAYRRQWDFGAGTGGFSFTGRQTRSAQVRPDVVAPPTGATLSGTVYQDADEDQEITAGDVGFAGLEVLLKNAAGQVLQSTTTGADGSYSFGNLAAGTYSIEVVVNDATLNTMFPQLGTAGGTVDPSWAAVTDIDLGAGEVGSGYNLGFWVNAS